MSGVANPTFIVTEPFGAQALAQYIQLPIPTPDQTAIEPGAASFDTGFTPLNMTDLAVGGVPPRGKDMNGILYTATQYCALLQAGQIINYNAAAATAFVGYKVGARVSSTTPGRVWVNILDGNVNNPDVDQTGWYALDPFTSVTTPPAGTLNDLVLPGASDFALDINTVNGAIDITGFIAERNGQTIYLSNTGANLLRVMANNVGSVLANRIRAASNLALVQNQTLTLRWFSGITQWLLI